MFNSVATYLKACTDSLYFQSSLAHLIVGMTLLSLSLFEQVDSTFSPGSAPAIQQPFQVIIEGRLNARAQTSKS